MMKPNKLLVLDTTGVTGPLAQELGVSQGDIIFFYVMWSDTASEILMNRMKEIALRLDIEYKDMNDADLLREVLDGELPWRPGIRHQRLR